MIPTDYCLMPVLEFLKCKQQKLPCSYYVVLRTVCYCTVIESVIHLMCMLSVICSFVVLEFFFTVCLLLLCDIPKMRDEVLA